MKKKTDSQKATTSIIEEIEGQLEEILAKKKSEIEKSLEDRIKKEEIEAKQRIKELEREIEEEKESLTSYQTVLSEFEEDKENIRTQIKEHLKRAIQFQTQIESMAEQTQKELHEIDELNKNLERIHQEAMLKASSLSKELETKYGIIARIPQINEQERVDFDLENEIKKLKKIKELLGENETVEKEAVESRVEQGLEKQEEPDITQGEPEEVKTEDEEEKLEEPEEEGEEPAETKPEEEEAEEEERREEEVETAEVETQKDAEEVIDEEESISKEMDDSDMLESEAVSQEAVEELDKYRKKNNGLKFFENNEKTILDGEVLISSVDNCLEEAKKLYEKLSKTESPKEQFFMKQEIIWQQEIVRELMLGSLRMCQKESCSLPEYTLDILNADVLKSVFEKVSMENWSNKESFSEFDEYMQELKKDFYARITPRDEYIESLLKELKIEESEEPNQ